jgi:polyribonucleotide nucleotidyltransferase
MFEIHREELDWAGRKLVLETGRIARQADGAVVATYGETTVLATVVSLKAAKPGVDFFPLTVNYQEKAFAAGRIPGGYFKREGRPSEKETLVSRLIDRPIRPLFPDGYRNETQVVATVLSHGRRTIRVFGDGRGFGGADAPAFRSWGRWSRAGWLHQRCRKAQSHPEELKRRRLT